MVPCLTYFSHVLPLDYELSLTPYEIIGKLLHWLDGLTKTVNTDNAAIADLQKRVKDLEDHGFTDEQLEEVLEEMIAAGDFDFLFDLINSRAVFDDMVGLEPYAQVLPEMVGEDLAGYSFQSMAFGDISGVKVGFFGFNHATDDLDDGSLAITINLTTGLVIGYSKINSGHMNSVGFNPTDSLFYVTPGAAWNKIVVYDYECNIVKEINSTDPSMKAGGICFKDENAYIVWYAISGADSTIKLNRVEHLESYNAITSEMYDGTATWQRGATASIGRQDIYCDDQYIYMPTYRHKDMDSPHFKSPYNMQDVFSMDTLHYVRSQYIDSRMEVNGGTFFNGTYYLGLNINSAGFICKASVKPDSLSFNSAWQKITQMANAASSYGPAQICITGSKTGQTPNFFADGSEVNKGFGRLNAALTFTAAFARISDIKYALSGDLTIGGQIKQWDYRNAIQRVTFEAYTDPITHEMDEAVLPKLTLDSCRRVVINDVIIKTYDSNYCLFVFDTSMCRLHNVKFVNGNNSNTIESVLRVENSFVNVDTSSSGKIGFDGTIPTAYVQTLRGGICQGNFYKNYDDTSQGNIGMNAFSMALATNVSGSLICTMTDAGLTINGTIALAADFASGATVASLPSDNKQILSSKISTRGTYGYLIGATTQEAAPLRYNYSTGVLSLLKAIDSGETIYINGLIEVGSVTV